MLKDFRSIANMYDSRKCTHPSSNCAKKRQKQHKYNSTQIIAGPFLVHVLHHCQHQTPQSYRGDKVMYCTLIVILWKTGLQFVVVERYIFIWLKMKPNIFNCNHQFCVEEFTLHISSRLLLVIQAKSLISQGVGLVAAASGLNLVRVRLSLAFDIFLFIYIVQSYLGTNHVSSQS